MYIVYCHTNCKNGKPYFGWAIVEPGQTYHDAMMRHWKAHCANQRNDLFARAIRKWGSKDDVWQHEVIEVMRTREGIKHAKKLWIAQRHTCAFDPGGHGYNMTRGGDGGGMLGHVPSQQHREKISKALIGKPKSETARKKMSIAKTGERHPNWGKKRPPEVGQKVSLALRGEKGPNAKFTEIAKLDIVARWANRHVIKVTQHQLADDHGVTQSTVSRLLSGATWRA